MAHSVQWSQNSRCKHDGDDGSCHQGKETEMATASAAHQKITGYQYMRSRLV